MAELCATQHAGRWRLLRRDKPCTESETLSKAGVEGRAAAWKAAKILGTKSSPWELEYFKACLGEPEVVIGLAEMLAADCESQLANDNARRDCTVSAPACYLNLRTTCRAFARRGLVVDGVRWGSFVDRAQFAVASLGAGIMLLAYMVRFSRYNTMPEGRDGMFLAVHGEWSNRTRHVLSQLGANFPADAIILLGRVRTEPDQIIKDWSGRLQIKLPPVIIPISPRSAIRAIPQMLNLLRQGIYLLSRQEYLPGLRDHSAIVFRVLLGAVMQQWWKESGFSGGKVVYGHTGTADTTMLEKSQQNAGAETIHVVHGVATGPNFLGFSDVAVFRCGHDAQLYRGLHQYGRCISPPSSLPTPKRGKTGLLVLTNYAHPMNPGYTARGLADELSVLRDVAAVASQLGPRAKPLLWKPNPVLTELPAPLQKQLLDEAKSLGYERIPHPSRLSDVASQVRWLLVTPSTATLDLLVEGYLCIVLDWQVTPGDTAPSKFPTRVFNTAELQDMISQLDTENAYRDRFQAAWSIQEPAQVLDIATLIKGRQ